MAYDYNTDFNTIPQLKALGLGNAMNTAVQNDPMVQAQRYQTNAPDYNQLFQKLFGAQMRSVDLAGSNAAAQAAARGNNPYSYVQHATAPVYGQYSEQFGNLPEHLFGMQLGANDANFNHLMAALAFKQKQKEYEDSKGGFLSGLGGLIGGAAGAFGSGIGSKAGANLGSKLFS